MIAPIGTRHEIFSIFLRKINEKKTVTRGEVWTKEEILYTSPFCKAETYRRTPTAAKNPIKKNGFQAAFIPGIKDFLLKMEVKVTTRINAENVPINVAAIGSLNKLIACLQVTEPIPEIKAAEIGQIISFLFHCPSVGEREIKITPKTTNTTPNR